MLIPWNVVGAMWNIFTLPEIGLLGYFLNHVVGINYDMTQDPLAAWVTIIVMDVWHWTSLVVLLAMRVWWQFPMPIIKPPKLMGRQTGRCFAISNCPKSKMC